MKTRNPFKLAQSRLLALVLVACCSNAAVLAANVEAKPGGSTIGEPSGVPPEAWDRMRQQIQKDQMNLREMAGEGGRKEWRSSNHSQDLTARFDGTALILSSPHARQDGWRLRMEFAGYGYDVDLSRPPVTEVVAVSNRLEYVRGPVTEWWRNEPTGLEHGFTLHARPAGEARTGPLRLALALEDGMRARSTECRAQAVDLADVGGAIVRYGGLKVWDARGEMLRAWMEVSAEGRRIDIVVEDGDARYPVVVDPTFALVKKLTPNETEPGTFFEFGFSVSASGDVVVVGAYKDDLFFNDAGLVYVFERNTGGPNTWGQVKKITGPGGRGQFGGVLSVGGDVIVVGYASGEERRGAAYVFERNLGGAGNWGQAKYLTASDGAAGDGFGSSVSVSGGGVVVGARWDDTGANEDQGSAYVFERNAGGVNNWGQVKKLIASDGATGDGIFMEVAVSGDVIVFTAAYHDVEANMNQGSAYLFERNAGGANNWGQTKKFTATDGAANDLFGVSVSVNSNVVVVGQSNGVEERSAAYVFERDTGGTNNWGQSQRLTGGQSVAVGGDLIVVGHAPFGGQGSAKVFQRTGSGTNNWELIDTLTAFDGGVNDGFGSQVSVSGDLVAVAGPSRAGAYVLALPRAEAEIIRHPRSQTNFTGDTVTFTVVAISTETLGYQWYKNGVALMNGGRIAGATSSNLVLSALQFSDAGAYTVVASNSFGSVTSAVAQLVVESLGILQQPQDQLRSSGLTASFSVVARGAGLNYQWYKDGTALFDDGRIAGATTPNLFVTNVQSSDAGGYQVGVDNSFAILYSRIAMLEVIDLGGAVDTTNLVWGSGDFSRWFAQSAVSHDGVDAVQSTPGSYIQTTVTGPGVVAFWWKVSSMMDHMFLGFSIDGVVRHRISGEEDWGQVAFAIPAGNHSLRWLYSAADDQARAAGQDSGWLDEVVFAPDAGPPVIVNQPVGQRVGWGDALTLTAGVGGATPRTNQWFVDGIELSDSTNASLTLSNFGPGQVGTYRLIVRNAAGTTTSSNAVITMTTNAGIQTVLLLVDNVADSPYRAALNNLGRSHQLFTDSAVFSSAVAAADPVTTLVVVDSYLTNRSLNAVGGYANAGGRAVLQYFGLKANSSLAPAFNALVSPITVPQLPVYDWGASSFFAGLSGPMDFERQIFGGQVLAPTAGGQAVAGFTSLPTPGQAAVVVGHSGRTIINGCILEEVTNGIDRVRFAQNEIDYFYRGLAIAAQPMSQNARQGVRVTNSVVAFSPYGPLTYQWRFHGTNLPGATSSHLVITNVQLAHEGAYSVVVSDTQGSVTSSNATLTVLILISPSFVQPPLSQSIVVGGSVTFSAQFTGRPPPFTSEWRRLTVPLATNIFVSSDPNSFLTLTNVRTNDAADYRLVIKSASSPTIGVAAPQFKLTVLADSDGDGLPDVWETAYPMCIDPALDCDNDGLTNLEEYRAGTNPTNGASMLRIDRVTAGNSATLEFPAVSNQTYTVQYGDRVESELWSKLIDVVARATNRIETVVDSSAGTNRYYRLVTPRQP